MKKLSLCGVIFQITPFVLILTQNLTTAQNLSCYQCTRNSPTDCSQDELSPCPSMFDRCVTSVKKNADIGYEIKRECGLGPCSFNDIMLDEGLNWNNCDRTKEDYFCFSCCKGNGCNKGAAASAKISLILIFVVVFVAFLTIFERFQPPYVSKE